MKLLLLGSRLQLHRYLADLRQAAALRVNQSRDIERVSASALAPFTVSPNRAAFKNVEPVSTLSN